MSSCAQVIALLLRHPRLVERLMDDLACGDETYLDAVIHDVRPARPDAVKTTLRAVLAAQRNAGKTSSAILCIDSSTCSCGIVPMCPPAPTTTPAPRSSASSVSRSITVSREPTMT